jgi:hypothetical protein
MFKGYGSGAHRIVKESGSLYLAVGGAPQDNGFRIGLAYRLQSLAAIR